MNFQDFPIMIEQSIIKFLKDKVSTITVNGNSKSVKIYPSYPIDFKEKDKPIIVATMISYGPDNFGLGGVIPNDAPNISATAWSDYIGTALNHTWGISIFTGSLMENRIIAGKLNQLFTDVADGTEDIHIFEFDNLGSNITATSNSFATVWKRSDIVSNTVFNVPTEKDYMTNMNIPMYSVFTEVTESPLILSVSAISVINPPVTSVYD